MIKIENVQVVGFESAIRGMRNPMNSWDKSDTIGDKVGPNDLALMLRLAKAGPVEGKFRRMIVIYLDITAPLYWWKEFDTYKVGTVANSCSTMHKIHEKEFTLDDFSHEHLMDYYNQSVPLSSNEISSYSYIAMLHHTIDILNRARTHYLETKDKDWWWQMIQLLPSSYNQRRTIMLNYEVLANIYKNRHTHKLDEWRAFCSWIEELPYSQVITLEEKRESPKQLTYGQIYDKFEQHNPDARIVNYRPYPYKCNSIIIWDENRVETAYEYIPEEDIFVIIQDAVSYEEILNKMQES